jgi:hypothetical protein
MAEQFISGADELPSAHVLALVKAYAKVLDAVGYSPAPYPDTSERCGRSHHAGAKYDCLNHAYWMCGRIEDFVATNRMPKALRWLGTVQGMRLRDLASDARLLRPARLGPDLGRRHTVNLVRSGRKQP